MSDLIGNAAGSEIVSVDADCPDCGSGNVLTKENPAIDLDETGSVWCDDCGHGWWL